MNKQTIKPVKVSSTGVQFGSCWLSHEKITGYTADQLNSGDCNFIGGQYVAWLSAEEPAPVFDEAKERELFEEYHAIASALEGTDLESEFRRKEDGEYLYIMAAEGWKYWQACAKSRARSAE